MKNALPVSLTLVGLALIGIGMPASAAGLTAPDGASISSLPCSESIPLYRKALADAPKDAVLHNRLGVCYQRVGETKLARKEYERATESRQGLRRRPGTIWAPSTMSPASTRRPRASTEKPSRRSPSSLLPIAISERPSSRREKSRRESWPTVRRSESTRRRSRARARASPWPGFPRRLSSTSSPRSALPRDEWMRPSTTSPGPGLPGFSDMDRVRNDADFKDVVKDARFSAVVR